MTKKQKEVIKLLQSGDWELGERERQLNASTPLPKGYWLQKGGLRKGGEVKKVSQKTVYSLIKMGVLTPFVLRQSSLTMEGERFKV